jgi:hypothetical protein
MRQTIYNGTKADVKISGSGEISASAKLPRLSKPLRLSKVKRKSSAPSYYLGSAKSPTADFLQVWLKSSRSDPRRKCCLLFM